MGSLGAGIFGANAASSAASQQAKTAQQAINAQLAAQEVIQGQLAPWLGAGQNALFNLTQQLGTAPGTAVGASPLTVSPFSTFGTAPSVMTPGIQQLVQSSPGYQFQLQQGVDAIQNAGVGKTGTLSGNTLKALDQYGQGLAGTEFMNYLNQLNQAWGQNVGTQTGYQQLLYNMLSGLSGTGAQAATNQGNFLTTGAGNVGNLLTNLGSIQAGGTLGGASLLSGGINNALAALTNPGASGVSPLNYIFGAGGASPNQFYVPGTSTPLGGGGGQTFQF